MSIKSPQKKGKDFEREIAKHLSKRFDVQVRRTPCSGAIHDFMSQDIIALDPESIISELHIECKKQQSLNAHSVYWRTKSMAKSGKKAVVIWKKNFDPEPVVVMGYEDWCDLIEEASLLREYQKKGEIQ